MFLDRAGKVVDRAGQANPTASERQLAGLEAGLGTALEHLESDGLPKAGIDFEIRLSELRAAEPKLPSDEAVKLAISGVFNT